ncbi:MAG: hypothetical protein Q4A33_01395, partial [Candidatus Saccharibacteria bacterium]|nr:hypothetical protein [Candidatus Saccharibacteria bacterium]
MNPKYMFTDQEKVVRDNEGNRYTVHRIKALRDIPLHGVKEGDLGGWVETQDNLSQSGDDSWVADEAVVFDKADVRMEALVCGHARVFHFARVYCSAIVTDYAKVFGVDGEKIGDTEFRHLWCPTITGSAIVSGRAKIYGSNRVGGFARVFDYAEVSGNAKIEGFTRIFGHAEVN